MRPYHLLFPLCKCVSTLVTIFESTDFQSFFCPLTLDNFLKCFFWSTKVPILKMVSYASSHEVFIRSQANADELFLFNYLFRKYALSTSKVHQYHHNFVARQQKWRHWILGLGVGAAKCSAQLLIQFEKCIMLWLLGSFPVIQAHEDAFHRGENTTLLLLFSSVTCPGLCCLYCAVENLLYSMNCYQCSHSHKLQAETLFVPPST